MKSSEKFDLVVGDIPNYGKDWVTVTFKLGRSWIPSFEDLFRILVAIGDCEDKKYPGGKGRWMVADFVAASLRPGATWESVRDRFEIPTREAKGNIITRAISKLCGRG